MGEHKNENLRESAACEVLKSVMADRGGTLEGAVLSDELQRWMIGEIHPPSCIIQDQFQMMGKFLESQRTTVLPYKRLILNLNRDYGRKEKP